MKTSPNISFVHKGKTVHLDLTRESTITPTTTLLQYLRSKADLKGTKEGCAEGDCGACTVSLAHLNEDGELEYKAYDSCLIFLPMIHGSQLITVEDVGVSGQLHPVQQSMVDRDGSQCGYCTPGFVMSMFALYKNKQNPSRAEIDDALTGNLCRCTGYRSIVEAAAESCVHNGIDHFLHDEEEVIAQLRTIRQTNAHLEIETGRQNYYRPKSLSKALELRAAHQDAIVISGATDIALLVTKKNKVLEQVIDLSGVKELKEVEVKADHYQYGSGTSLEVIKTHCKDALPALYDCLEVFGSVQIRNLGTLGGNIGSASPIGDLPVILQAYEATLILQSVEGKRSVKLTDFITGYRETILKADELVTQIQIPKTPKGVHIKWYKISKRKDLDISTVSGGFRLELDKDHVVKNIRLYYGGMAAMIKNANKTTQFLVGKKWERDNVEQAMDLIDQDFTPISDARSSAAGRKVMARNLLLKFWNETTKFDLVY